MCDNAAKAKHGLRATETKTEAEEEEEREEKLSITFYYRRPKLNLFICHSGSGEHKRLPLFPFETVAGSTFLLNGYVNKLRWPQSWGVCRKHHIRNAFITVEELDAPAASSRR
ncbi:hypothetical protein TNCV_511431 [Trichonephila clavipes]|nr:hypothetical protein TNCV_511431 [Trichonephila clavipes]